MFYITLGIVSRESAFPGTHAEEPWNDTAGQRSLLSGKYKGHKSRRSTVEVYGANIMTLLIELGKRKTDGSAGHPIAID